jgi:hypothetical protein
MKNIFLLPTDQLTSVLYGKDDKYKLANSTMSMDWFISSAGYKPKHIYITSDEELPYDDSIFATGAFYHRDAAKDIHIITKDTFHPNPNFCSRIILTTDDSLFKYGVQEIDNEFLEWFIKNPTCEFINVEKEELKSIYNPNYKDFTTEGTGIYLTPKDTALQTNETLIEDNIISYIIIIPQEEPKQEKKPHSFCETPDEKCTMNYCDDNGCQNRKRHLVEPHEQEILPEFTLSKNIFDKISDLPKGETSYSEDEVLELLKKSHFVEQNIEEWFNQNKKK